MKVINLTPHDVTEDGVTYPRPQDKTNIARVSEQFHDDETFSYGSPVNLPPPNDGVVYIVSLPVVLGAPSRTDLRIAAGQIRDDQGRIIGCTAIAKLRV